MNGFIMMQMCFRDTLVPSLDSGLERVLRGHAIHSLYQVLAMRTRPSNPGLYREQALPSASAEQEHDRVRKRGIHQSL